MKAKKLFPAIVALLFLISVVLVGCSSDGDSSGGNESDSKVTVDIFQFK